MTQPQAVVVALLLAIIGGPRSGVSQDFCARVLADRPFPNLRNATNPEENNRYWSVTWELAFSRMAWLDSVSRGLVKPQGSYSYQEWFFDSTDIPLRILSLAPKDDSSRWSAAFELADLLDARTVAATEGMGYAAASLYRAWRLPPEPAAALLADPPVTTTARTRAVIALEPYWPTQTFRNSAAAALCIVAANAAGRALLRHTDSLSKFDAIDMDEHELVSRIVLALGPSPAAGGLRADAIIRMLPAKNPLTTWLRGAFEP